MSETELLSIPAGTLRAVWVFRLDLPEEQVEAFRNADHETQDDPPPWPLRDALGVSHLDEDFIEVFKAEKLEEYGFARYLIEANGMDADSVAPDAEMLDALKGHVVLVFSQSLPSTELLLDPRPPLHLLGRYTEQVDFTVRRPPATDAAKPEPEATDDTKATRKPPSDAAMSGRVAMLALLVMALLVILMIWVAG